MVLFAQYKAFCIKKRVNLILNVFARKAFSIIYGAAEDKNRKL